MIEVKFPILVVQQTADGDGGPQFNVLASVETMPEAHKALGNLPPGEGYAILRIAVANIIVEAPEVPVRNVVKGGVHTLKRAPRDPNKPRAPRKKKAKP